VITLGVTGVTFHDIKFGVLISERNGGDHIGTKINTQNKDSRKGKGHLAGNEEQERGNLGNVGGESVGNRFLQVVENKTAFFNTINNGREVIIKQKHISGVLGDIRAGTHGDTNIGLLNSGGIIDTITGNSDDMTKTLASINNKEFLGRSSTGENDLGLTDPVHNLTSLFNFHIIKSIFSSVDTGEFITVDNDRLCLFPGFVAFKFGVVLQDVVKFKLGVRNNVNLGGNSSGSWGLITSDHNNLNTGGLALGDRDIDLGSGGIVEGSKTNKAEVPHGEPSSNASIEFTNIFPDLPLLNIEFVGGLVENRGVKLDAGKSEHTLTLSTKLIVSSFSFFNLGFTEITFLSLNKDSLAAAKNTFWGTLNENPGVFFSSGRRLVFLAHVTDLQVELNVG
jgi:hypothetical protein